VFLRDLIVDAPLRSPLEYARRYYARYPALSIGHHPLIPAIAEVPFFFLFGVSIVSARLATLCAFAVAVVFWFKLIENIYNTHVALFASLLFVFTPGLIPLFQTVLSEPFALCLIVLSLYFLQRYCVNERAADGVAFGVFAVLSVYAKQLAVFMLPVYLYQFVSVFGVRRLFRPSTLLTMLGMIIALVPLAIMTLRYSQSNVGMITRVSAAQRTAAASFWKSARGLWNGPFSLGLPVVVLSIASSVGAAVRRDRRAVIFGVWVLAVYVGLLMLGLRIPRFFVYWIPAFCALAAAVGESAGTERRARTVGATLVGTAIVCQVFLGAANPFLSNTLRPAGAAGYEEAARYVVANRRGDTVLYSAAVDTGYFTFFIRKHDPEQSMVVLRADKLLTTSRMGRPDFERRISARNEILPLLRTFGVGYVVLEDVPYPDGPLEWLTQTVKTADFELQQRIPMRSTDRRLAGTTLSIYTVKGSGRADPAAAVSINMPLINDRIEVLLSDLIPGRDTGTHRER